MSATACLCVPPIGVLRAASEPTHGKASGRNGDLVRLRPKKGGLDHNACMLSQLVFLQLLVLPLAAGSVTTPARPTRYLDEVFARVTILRW